MSVPAAKVELPSRLKTFGSAGFLHRMSVLGLSLFLLTQCFTLPVLGKGPSWTLWQSIPDLLLWLTGFCAVLYRKPPGSAAQRQVLWGLVYLLGMSFLALGVLFIYNDPMLSTELRFGAFAIYRLVQVMLVFWTVSRLDFTAILLARWSVLTQAAFILTCLGIIISTFTGAPTEFLATYLPHGQGISGPWESYYLYQERGLGFVGFNHGYPALQVMLLGAFALYLRGRLRQPGGEWILLLALAASFLSNSRAGLAGCLVFVALQLLRYPVRATFTLLGISAVGALFWSRIAPNLGSTTSRQATLLDASDSGNLAGRTDIWQSIFGELLSDPYRLLIGSGLGSAVINKGNNAHNMILQILFETGLVGLVNVGAFFALLLALLRRAGIQAQVIMNVTIGFLITSLTQETFFPNVAFGSFLPLYALVVAVVISRPPPAFRGTT